MIRSLLGKEKTNYGFDLNVNSITLKNDNDLEAQIYLQVPNLSQYQTSIQGQALISSNAQFWFPDPGNDVVNWILYSPSPSPPAPYPFYTYRVSLVNNAPITVFTQNTAINTNYKVDINLVVNNVTDRTYSASEMEFAMISQGALLTNPPTILPLNNQNFSNINSVDSANNLSNLHPTMVLNAGSFGFTLTGVNLKVINVLIEVKILSI